MNVQTTPAAIALAPLKSGQQDDESFGTSKTDNAIPIEASEHRVVRKILSLSPYHEPRSGRS